MTIDWTPATLTTADGARLAVFTAEPASSAAGRDAAPPDDAARATAVLAHGWTLDHRSWEPVAARLLDAGVRVVAWDQRGHGASTLAGGRWRGSDESVHALGDDLAAVIADHAPTDVPLLVAGHSMGGMTVMAFAGTHPDLLAERVAGVTLAATSGGRLRPFAVPGEKYLVKLLSALPWRPGRLIGLRAQRRGFGVDPRPEDVAASRDQIAATRLATTGTFYRALMLHDEMASLAALADIPTRILVGTRDVLTPQRHARALAEALPSAELEVLEGKGHMLTYEAPDEVCAAILAPLA